MGACLGAGFIGMRSGNLVFNRLEFGCETSIWHPRKILSSDLVLGLVFGWNTQHPHAIPNCWFTLVFSSHIEKVTLAHCFFWSRCYVFCPSRNLWELCEGDSFELWSLCLRVLKDHHFVFVFSLSPWFHKSSSCWCPSFSTLLVATHVSYSTKRSSISRLSFFIHLSCCCSSVGVLWVCSQTTSVVELCICGIQCLF